MEHSFDVEIAQEFGVRAAILIRHFQFWIIHNKANGVNEQEGRTWTYNSLDAFCKIFPYWTKRQLRLVVDELVTKGVLVKGTFNKIKYDRTTWYAFKDEARFVNSDKWRCQNGRVVRTDAANRGDGKDEPIPNPKPNKNTDEQPNQKAELSAEDRLRLDLQIKQKADFLANKIKTILRPNKKEQITFRNILAHLIRLAQADPEKICFFTDAVEWARGASASNALSKKALFVATVKKETGFKAQKPLLRKRPKRAG